MQSDVANGLGVISDHNRLILTILFSRTMMCRRGPFHFSEITQERGILHGMVLSKFVTYQHFLDISLTIKMN